MAPKANTSAKVTRTRTKSSVPKTTSTSTTTPTTMNTKEAAPRKAASKSMAAKAGVTKKTATKRTATKRPAAKKTTAKGTATNETAPKKPAAQKTQPLKAAPKKVAVKSKAEASASEKAVAPTKAATRKRKTDNDAAAAPATKAAAAPKKAPAKKRKADDDAAAPPAKKVKQLVKGPTINTAPTQKLDVLVFGEGTAGELGLGTAKIAVDVKRPRLNANLSAKNIGVVQIAAGGMHCVAITHDNKVLTWGVNDDGALGRDTSWDGGLKDMDENKSDADSEDSDDDNGLNPKESTPGEVDWSQTEVADGTRFTQVAAGDSCCFVLTDDGKVYGWGTFRGNEGPFGFTPETNKATRPILVPDLKNVISVVAGSNHALALDTKGSVYAWGSGQQNQLGRRLLERNKTEGLKPREFGLPKGAAKGIKYIASGGYHSFAISKKGDVYGWGLNNFGNTGIMKGAGGDDAVITNPQIVKSLAGKNIASLTGGMKHSLAVTESGDCLAWGRVETGAIGISLEDLEKLPDDAVIRGANGKPAIVAIPQKVTAIAGPVSVATANSETSIAVTKEGKAWSWGFSANYQTGLGVVPGDSQPVATLIDNTAVRDRKLNGAGGGGQFSFVTAIASDE